MHVQLELDLPGFYLKGNQRVRLLEPHEKAGRTGRIVTKLITGYLIAIPGKYVTATRQQLQAIK